MTLRPRASRGRDVAEGVKGQGRGQGRHGAGTWPRASRGRDVAEGVTGQGCGSTFLDGGRGDKPQRVMLTARHVT